MTDTPDRSNRSQDELDERADDIGEQLEEALEDVDSQEEAEAVVEEIADNVGDRPAVEVAEEVPDVEDFPVEEQVDAAAKAVEEAAEAGTEDVDTAAQVLEEVAKEATALEGRAHESVSEAVQDVTAPAVERPEELERPRRYLLDALLKQPGMSRLHRYDTELFLFLNTKTPRNVVTDTLFHQISFWFSGGWAWLIGVAIFLPVRRKRALAVLEEIVLPIWVTSLVVEWPVKKYFRRRRPFIDLVRAVVVGKKPGNWSFPSGHAAGAFAGAQILGRCLPRWRPLWYTIAGLVGFSRIYLGAHYPADVISGSLFGVSLAEVTRWLVTRIRDQVSGVR